MQPGERPGLGPGQDVPALPMISVPGAKGGATYEWTVTNGTIDSGQGTRSIQFTPGSSGDVLLGVTVTNAAGCSESDDATIGIVPCP